MPTDPTATKTEPDTAAVTALSPPAWPVPVQRALLAGLVTGVAVALAGGAALANSVSPSPGPWALGMLVVGHLALLLASLVTRRRPPAMAWRAVPALWLGSSLLAVLGGLWLGWQQVLLALPMLIAAVCLAGSGAGRQGTLAAAAGALAIGLGLAWAELRGLLPVAPAVAWLPMVVLALALVGAALLAHLLYQMGQQQRHAAMRQAQRWQAMRRLATDVCWETDATLRITSLAWRNRHGRLMPLTDDYLGRRPWDMPTLTMDDEVQDLLRAEVDGRDRIKDLPVAWQCPDGRKRHYLISGEADFDGEGRFVGYWGVARDVSVERTARRAMQAASRRYLRLFRRMPAPLVVHRDGRILDANAAAASLLGYDQPDAMLGHDLLGEHMDEEQREMALERLDDLDADPGLEALPVVPRRLLRCDGAPVFTLATGLRTDHEGKPAMLAIYLDETTRHAALQAQHRCDTLMSRVLSLCPDIVALCTLEGGRCVMVNDSLGRLLGLGRSSWVGAGAAGPWRRPADHEHLLRAVQAGGGVRDLPMAFATADAGERTLLVTATIVALDDGRYLLLNARPAPGGFVDPVRDAEAEAEAEEAELATPGR